MKRVLFYILIIFALINVSGCQKSMDEPAGDLVVNARDGAGASLIGFTVYLYYSEADFNNNLYSETLVTDNSGQVRFESLYPADYYVDCDFENMAGETVIISGLGSVYDGIETTITIRP